MRAVKLGTIVAAIRKQGGSWHDEALLDRFASLPRKKGVAAIATKKLPTYLTTLAIDLSEVLPMLAARSFAGSFTLLRVVADLDMHLREEAAKGNVRQSTEFELTTLHGGLLAARMLWIESLREIVLREIVLGESGSSSAELRVAAVAEVTVDVVRRYAAASRGLPLHDSVSAASATSDFDSSVAAVTEFLRSDISAFAARTDRVCEGLGIAS